jgi:hypothetical protein
MWRFRLYRSFRHVAANPLCLPESPQAFVGTLFAVHHATLAASSQCVAPDARAPHVSGALCNSRSPCGRSTASNTDETFRQAYTPWLASCSIHVSLKRATSPFSRPTPQLRGTTRHCSASPVFPLHFGGDGKFAPPHLPPRTKHLRPTPPRALTSCIVPRTH